MPGDWSMPGYWTIPVYGTLPGHPGYTTADTPVPWLHVEQWRTAVRCGTGLNIEPFTQQHPEVQLITDILDPE